MSDNAMVVDDFVKYRKALRYTQEQLATLLGMSIRAIQDIENGRSKLRLVHVMAFEMILLREGAMRKDLSLVPLDVCKPALEVALLMKNAFDAVAPRQSKWPNSEPDPSHLGEL